MHEILLLKEMNCESKLILPLSEIPLATVRTSQDSQDITC